MSHIWETDAHDLPSEKDLVSLKSWILFGSSWYLEEPALLKQQKNSLRDFLLLLIMFFRYFFKSPSCFVLSCISPIQT